jgi:membrane complex biogenesis BtpA family protein
MMTKFTQILAQKAIIGMIHIEALPGTPKFADDIPKIIAKALDEASIYQANGIDALMIENMHDVPYLKNDVGHEISSLMAIIAYQIKQQTGLPLGIQILAGANKAALSAAKNAGADFIRAEGFVFGHVADEGYIDSNAAELLRFRKHISANDIAVFTDIKKKHSSHAVTDDLDIAEMAHAAEFFLADGVIVTGMHTGDTADSSEINKVKSATKLPVIVGSGINYENISEYLPLADAFIVGSYFKKDGYWENDLDAQRINEFMKKVNSLR